MEIIETWWHRSRLNGGVFWIERVCVRIFVVVDEATLIGCGRGGAQPGTDDEESASVQWTFQGLLPAQPASRWRIQT